MPDFNNFLSKANRLLSGARLTAGQAWNQVKTMPDNTASIREATRSIPGVSDIHAPDAWDAEASMRAAKDRLLGLWRGYVAPALNR